MLDDLSGVTINGKWNQQFDFTRLQPCRIAAGDSIIVISECKYNTYEYSLLFSARYYHESTKKNQIQSDRTLRCYIGKCNRSTSIITVINYPCKQYQYICDECLRLMINIVTIDNTTILDDLILITGSPSVAFKKTFINGC